MVNFPADYAKQEKYYASDEYQNNAKLRLQTINHYPHLKIQILFQIVK